jgi:hypothetical protein
MRSPRGALPRAGLRGAEDLEKREVIEKLKE